MAQSLPISSNKLSTAFLLAIFSFTTATFDHLVPYKETKMTLFFQDISSGCGTNATEVKVAGIPGAQWDFLKFGTVFVTDNPITAGIKRDSDEVGRGQGIYVTSSLDGMNTHVLISISFTNKKYNGSTLEIQGRSIQLAPVREVSIVSGTGKFRFARGYATFETLFYQPATFYSVIRCNVTVRH